MKNETWRKLAKGLGIAGAIGGAAAAGAGLIKVFKPEANDLPTEHAIALKEMVKEAMQEETKKLNA